MRTQLPGRSPCRGLSALLNRECKADKVVDKFAQYFDIESLHVVVEGSDFLTGPIPVCGGLPKRISKGLRPCLLLIRVRM